MNTWVEPGRCAMPNRYPCNRLCGATCTTLRVRGSAIAVYFSGLGWLFVGLMNTGDPDLLRASLALGPASIAIGGSAVFLANTDHRTNDAKPEWLSVAYFGMGSFSSGLSFASLPVWMTTLIAVFYALVIGLSIPPGPTEAASAVGHTTIGRSVSTVVVGNPVGVTAQPVPIGETEMV